MARPLRIQYPGALYHITARGNAKQTIFFDDRDRRVFLQELEKVLRMDNWRCHAHCLMGNHYHLLIETCEPNLAHGMRQLNGLYTQRFHAHHGTVGHILQGRYKAFLIEKETYLQEVARYIVLNPVRARMVKNPSEYAWSSYRTTAGHRSAPSWLTVDSTLQNFAASRHRAQLAYRDFVRAGIGAASPMIDAKSYVLGSLQFHRAMSRAEDELLKETPRVQRIISRPTLEELFDAAETIKERDAGMCFAVIRCGYFAAEVARFLGVHPSLVSKVIARNSRFKT